MRKLLVVAGVALVVLLLVSLSGAAFASPQAPVPSIPLGEEIAAGSRASVSPDDALAGQDIAPEVVDVAAEPAASQVILQDEGDDPPGTGDEHPEAGDDHPEGQHAEGAYGHGNANGEMLTIKVNAAAEFLGLTSEEVIAQVEAGKWLYEIAEEQGADVEAFVEAVHAAIGDAGGCGCGSH